MYDWPNMYDCNGELDKEMIKKMIMYDCNKELDEKMIEKMIAEIIAFQDMITEDYDRIWGYCLGDYGSKEQWIKEALEDTIADESIGYDEDWLKYIRSEFN